MDIGPQVLYIEDNADSRKLVERILLAYGFRIHAVENGEAGLAYVAQVTPDLILLDINLPDYDGYELAARLRENELLTSVPIVALTANVMKQDRDRSSAAGCNGFIEKPLDVDILPDKIRSYLQDKSVR